MKTIEIGTCRALVPVAQPTISQKLVITRARPDAPFVTQLIATAAGESQTRALRRATRADALKGYGCMAVRSADPFKPNGVRVSLVA